MSQQGLRQASVRAATGTALTYEGDWLALFDAASIPAGTFNGRLLAWINAQLGASYTELNGAMQAYAVSQGAASWSEMGTFSPGGAAAPLRAVVTRGAIPSQGRVQATTEVLRCRQSRMRHYIGEGGASEIRMVLCGYYTLTTGGEVALGNDVTVEADFEINGVCVPFTWGGSQVGTIPNGAAEYVSDPLYPAAFSLTEFAAGAECWSKTRRTVALNGYHQVYEGIQNPALAPTGVEIVRAGDPSLMPTRIGTAGALPISGDGTGTTSVLQQVLPVALIGRRVSAGRAFMLVGDSIVTRYNDNNGDGSNSNGGFAQRALYNVDGAGKELAYFQTSCPSERAADFVLGTRRQELFKYADYVFCNYGTNDLGGSPAVPATAAATLRTNLRTIWAAARTAGCKVHPILLMPRATGTTDSWATLANQTINANFATARGLVNADIAADASLHDGAMNLNTAVADSVETDKWVVNGTANYATNDGLHPFTSGHSLAAAVMRTFVTSNCPAV